MIGHADGNLSAFHDGFGLVESDRRTRYLAL